MIGDLLDYALRTHMDMKPTMAMTEILFKIVDKLDALENQGRIPMISNSSV